jgi:hypothetical protein
VRVTPATLSDLRHVVDNLSTQNQAEQEILGNTRWMTLKTAYQWLDGAVTAWWHEDPGFIFGIRPNHTSWFLATQQYFDGGAKAILAGRHFVRQMRTLHGGFVTLSRSPHPDADRWFRLIGLRAGTPMGDVKVWWCGSTPPVSLDIFRACER